MTYGCCLGDCGRKCSIVSSIHIIIVGLVHLDTKVWLELGTKEIYGYLAGNSFYRLVGCPRFSCLYIGMETMVERYIRFSLWGSSLWNSGRFGLGISIAAGKNIT